MLFDTMRLFMGAETLVLFSMIAFVSAQDHGYRYPVMVSVTGWNKNLANFDIIGKDASQEGNINLIIHSQDEYKRLERVEMPFQVNEQATLELLHPHVEEKKKSLRRRRDQQSAYETIPDFDCYRTVTGTNDTMMQLEKDYPDLVTVMDIGYSHRVYDPTTDETGSTIRLVKITSNATTVPQNNFSSTESFELYGVEPVTHEKGKLFIVAGVHSREYAPPEIALRFAERLAKGYGRNADITWILNHTEIYILPVANPDGRKIAETNRDLLWRKNRNFHGCSTPENDGVDLNRNAPFKYGEDASDDDVCSTTYRGPTVLSEVESQAVFDFAESIFPGSQRRGATVADAEANATAACGVDVTGVYLDLHSSGGIVYYPWGWLDNVASPDDAELQTMARKLASFGGYGLWGPGQPEFLYPVSGDMSDTMYGYHCVASFGFEVGTTFYENCTSFEETVFPVNYNALLYAAKVASAPFKIPKGPDVLSLKIENTTSDSITVTVLVSDEKRSVAYGEAFNATGSQNIAKVRVFVDHHPYTVVNSNGERWMNSTDGDGFNSPTEAAFLNINTADLLSGQHVLYVEAEDSAGFKGPISAAFFDV